MVPRLFYSSLVVVFLLSCEAGNHSGSGNHSQHPTAKMQTDKRKPNRLIHEKSPYLLQHAYNPVDWYPWGDDAFARARAEQKPIFLSVGYSTCHWCHVMERESFEQDSIAEVLNKYFVSIKVDREERPDVDRVYMTALQSMGQGGGWPMSMFLTPDLKPFYGGTYFPAESRYGRMGFGELLRRIYDVWEKEHAKVLESSNNITDYLRRIPIPAASAQPVAESILDTCYHQLDRSYDEGFGGFGEAPKFPRPVVFNVLLRYYHRTGEKRALEMTTTTLRKMSQGGMYDHLGGGFHRYAVDREWRVPHFEKMLYDQAQLVSVFADVYVITRDEYYSSIMRDVLDYVLRDMTHPEGGFYSAEDADSPRPEEPGESGEGAFYVWAKKEISEHLGNEAAKMFCYHYGVEEGGNVPVDPQHEFTGRNILYVAHPVDETARMFKKSVIETGQNLAAARSRLFEVRKQRPRPHLDDKIIASWNGLMISAFVRAYTAIGDQRYLDAARKAAGFLARNLYIRETKTLYRRFREGEAKFEAHLDDYNCMTQGFLDLYEASGDQQWLQRAVDLMETTMIHFGDEKNGGFFDTSGGDSSILLRTKEHYDGAEPAGNSVAAMNLLRLARMLDDDAWKHSADRTISAFAGLIEPQPIVMPQLLAAYDFSVSKPVQVILAGRTHSPEMRRMLMEIYSRYSPNKVVLYADGSAGQDLLAARVPFMKSIREIDGRPTVYVCENFACQLPTNDVDVLAQLLMKMETSNKAANGSQ
jgi:uncharacterized protein YyaL (SSP411 family)